MEELEKQEEIINTGEEKTPTARENFLSRVKSKYPDEDYENEETRYSMYGKYMDDVEGERNKYKESNDKFADAYARDPRFAAIAQEAVKEDGDVTSKMIEVYGRDAMEAWNDPEQLEALTEANNKYLANVAETEEIRKEQEKNKAESDKIISAFLEENGMGPEDGERFLEAYYQMIEDGLMGIVRKEYLESFMKAQNYESDLIDAAHAGEVKASNDRIERQKKEQIGDGVADVSHGSDDPVVRPQGKGMRKGGFYN